MYLNVDTHPSSIPTCRCSRDECCRRVFLRSCELGHQHSLDGSWHLLLSPKDALTVLDKGWGETGPAYVAQGRRTFFLS